MERKLYSFRYKLLLFNIKIINALFIDIINKEIYIIDSM